VVTSYSPLLWLVIDTTSKAYTHQDEVTIVSCHWKWAYSHSTTLHVRLCGESVRYYYQGCSANKKGVGTHPKNSHFKTASNSFWSKTWIRCGNAVPTPLHAWFLHNLCFCWRQECVTLLI